MVHDVIKNFEVKEIEKLTFTVSADSIVEHLKSKLDGKNKKYLLVTLEEVDGQQRQRIRQIP